MKLKQPLSPRTAAVHTRLRGATVTHGVCPYCAIGCGQLVYTKDGQIVNIEGDPRSPVSHGGLCPKGANTLQLVANPHRLTTVRYRAPYSDHWEEKPLDWALDRIAHLVKETRDAMKQQAEARVQQLRDRGVSQATLYGDVAPDQYSALHSFYLLLAEPGVYGLPDQAANPHNHLAGDYLRAALGLLLALAVLVAAFALVGG